MRAPYSIVAQSVSPAPIGHRRTNVSSLRLQLNRAADRARGSNWQDLREVQRGTLPAAQALTFESPDLVLEARKVGALQHDETAAHGLHWCEVVWRRLTVWDLCPC